VASGRQKAVTNLVSEAKAWSLHSEDRKPKLVVDAAWVKENLSKPGVMILDARAPKFLQPAAEAGQIARAGHIPGARNIPFFESGRRCK